MTEPAARILVVDDDPTSLLLMKTALGKAGFAVTTAADGREALELFREADFDMVMLDVEMPHVDGYEVCRRIRESVGDLLPIVMVTGMDDIRSVERSYESGASDFIAKPINLALIGHRARYLMRGYRAMLALRSADARNAAILEALPDLLFEVDIEGRYIDIHAPRDELLAVPRESLVGRRVADVLPAEAARVCLDALQDAYVNGVSIGMQYSLALPRGLTWFELSVSRKATDAGERQRFIVLSRDITERKEAEQRIARLAYFDALTGLPNRQSFLERVDTEILRTKRTGRKLAVLFMDLDGFKTINDTMGHSVGDLILQWAAERLRQGVRRSDAVTRAHDDGGVELARLGGDEFTALIVDIDRAEDALVVAHRILHLMRRPFVLEGREVALSTSVGIALYPENGQDAATLLKHADTAMYHAKDSGRGTCEFYSATLTERAVQRMELESSLRLALERQEFELEYQPQIDAASGRICSLEALIRWRHPERGRIPPAEFVSVAEENGLIVPIGRWVLQTACDEAMRWVRAGRRLSVAVNLSPLQFEDPKLLQSVLDALSRSGLDPGLLELEVTEGALMENSRSTMATLEALRDAGVRIALDDFGTGFSSLSYLKRMPISTLKIDRSFVSGLPDGAENIAIVRAILAMADSLGMAVTAEGVERLEQALALKQMGCDMLQGHFFSWSVPAEKLSPLLARSWPLGETSVGADAIGG